LSNLAEGGDPALAQGFERQRRRLFRTQSLPEIRHIQARPAAAREHPEMIIRAAGEYLGKGRIHTKLAGTETVLLCVMVDLFRSQTLRPFERENTLPEIPLVVQDLEALEHHRELLKELEIEPVSGGVEV